MDNHSEQDSQDLPQTDNTQQKPQPTEPVEETEGERIHIEDAGPLPLPEKLRRLDSKKIANYGLNILAVIVLVVAILAAGYTALVAKPVPESYDHPGYMGAPPILPVPMPGASPDQVRPVPMPNLPPPDGGNSE